MMPTELIQSTKSLSHYTVQDSTPKRRLGLFDLPQEIQDEILSLAYSRKSVGNALGPRPSREKDPYACTKGMCKFKAIGRLEGAFMRWHPVVRFAFRPSDSRTFKISSLLVSKRYFQAAAQAWFRTATLHAESVLHRVSLVGWNNEYVRPQQFLRTLESLHGVRHTCYDRAWAGAGVLDKISFKMCRSLKHLVLIIGEDFFRYHSNGPSAWSQIIPDMELLNILHRSRISMLRGLKTIEIRSPYLTSWRISPEPGGKCVKLQLNLYRLTCLARQEIMRPRNVSQITMESNELYSGSKVRFDSSKPRASGWGTRMMPWLDPSL